MWKNLLVEIFVPTTEAVDVGVRATGYPVGPKRVLTARHVLFPANRDDRSPIEVRWYHQRGPAVGWRPIERIAWDGGDRFDVALISCAFPEGVPHYGLLSADKPVDGLCWASEGFARAGRKDASGREPVPMLGEVHSTADDAASFHLGVRYEVRVDAGWKGASGSPVVVGNRILGVIISCVGNFDQTRLEATPVWKLLEDPDFRREIGIDTREERLASIRDKIAAVVRNAPAAMDELDEDGRTRHQDADARPEALARVILDLDIEQVLSRAKRAYKSLVDAGQTKDAAAVRQVANLAVPAVFDEGVVEGVRVRKSDLGAAVVALPAATRTIAEIIMAGVDRRQASFKASSGGEEEWPEGTLVLPMPPESGLKGLGEPFKSDFDAHLVDKFVDKRDRDRRSPQALVQHIANRLKRMAEEDHQTWYCVFDAPDEAAARAAWEAVFRDLKTRYPAILFIELSRDDDVWVRETDRFDPLRYLLLPGPRPT